MYLKTEYYFSKSTGVLSFIYDVGPDYEYIYKFPKGFEKDSFSDNDFEEPCTNYKTIKAMLKS